MYTRYAVVVGECFLVASPWLSSGLELLLGEDNIDEKDQSHCPEQSYSHDYGRSRGRRGYDGSVDQDTEPSKNERLARLLSVDIRHSRAPEEVLRDMTALLQDGADPNYCSRGQPLLFASLLTRKADLSRELLKFRADPDKMSAALQTPLMESIVAGAPEGTQVLLEAGADVAGLDKEGKSALIWATEVQSPVDVVRWLLEGGADKDVNHVSSSFCRTALSYAAERGPVETMRLLIRFRADVDLMGSQCASLDEAKVVLAPLHWAVTRESVEGVKVLVEARANVNARRQAGHIGKSNTALHEAAGCNWNPNWGRDDADANRPPSREHEPDPGKRVVDQRDWHSRIVETLLRADAEVNWQNEDGDTPLVCAMRQGYPWISSTLAKVSDIEIQNKENQTAIFMALYPTVVHTLADKMANLEHHDQDGNTPLLEAAKRGRTSVTWALLSRGADLTARNEEEPAQGISEVASFDEETLKQIMGKAEWTPLHWAAFSCDAYAAGVAMQKASDIWGILTKDNQTAFAIAEAKKSDCPGVFTLLKAFDDQWKETQRHLEDSREAAFRSLVATLVLSCGSCFVMSAFLRFQSLRHRGRCFFSILPTSIFAASLAISLANKAAPPDMAEEEQAHTERLILTGWVGCILASALFLTLLLVTMSPRLEACFVATKRWGFALSERFWERLDLVLNLTACAIVFWLECNDGIGDTSKASTRTLTICTSVLLSFAFILGLLQPDSLVRTIRLGAGCLALAWGLFECFETRDWLYIRPATVLLVFYNIVAAGFDARGPGEIGRLPGMPGIVDIELSSWKGRSDKFTASKFVMGKAEMAAHGLEAALGLGHDAVSEGLRDGLAAMEQEIVDHGDADDLDNFNYIVHGTSGDPDDIPAAVAASLQSGQYHGGSIGPHDFDTGHDGRRLRDWMELEEVKLARLTEAEFVAVRLYTSSSFRRINDPLRKGMQPHPWAMVVYFLDRGIKKLRAVQAQVNPVAFAAQTILWRGMRNMELDLVEFKQKGGTELAPMSTTTSEEVARHYAKSEVPLILKYPVSGLRTGVSIQFLSLYPKEEEFLYPPLTYMTFKRSYEDDDTTIIVVEPVMS